MRDDAVNYIAAKFEIDSPKAKAVGHPGIYLITPPVKRTPRKDAHERGSGNITTLEPWPRMGWRRSLKLHARGMLCHDAGARAWAMPPQSATYQAHEARGRTMRDDAVNYMAAKFEIDSPKAKAMGHPVFFRPCYANKKNSGP